MRHAVLWLVLLSGECLKWANLDAAQQKGFSVGQLFLTAGLAFLVILTAIYKLIGLDAAAMVSWAAAAALAAPAPFPPWLPHAGRRSWLGAWQDGMGAWLRAACMRACAQALLRWGYRRFTKGNRVLPKEALDDDAEDTELAVGPAKLAPSPIKLGSAAEAGAAKLRVPKLALEQTSSRDLLLGGRLDSGAGGPGADDGSAESPASSHRSGFLHSQAGARLLASRASSWASQGSPPHSARAGQQNGHG